MDLRLPMDRWARLADATGGSGNAGALAVVSLLTMWLRSAEPDRRAPVFSGTLDLRDYGGLGPVIGPLTDRIVFAVETEGFDEMTFSDLALRAHAGLLDSVVHYLPYDDVVALAGARALIDPRYPAQSWDIDVHYCRSPPASANTRGEETLASHGLSIELFRESALAGHGSSAPPGPDDGTVMQVQVAESEAAMALVVNFDDAMLTPTEVGSMLKRLDVLAARVEANPGQRLSSL
jgi:hypothetical protein